MCSAWLLGLLGNFEGMELRLMVVVAVLEVPTGVVDGVGCFKPRLKVSKSVVLGKDWTG